MKTDSNHHIENKRTKQKMPHYFQFYLDFKNNAKRFDVKSAVNMLKIPYLIIHGDKDKAVKINEGYDLHSWNKNNKLIIIKNGEHTFGSKHPWEENILPKDLQSVVSQSIDYINSYLNF